MIGGNDILIFAYKTLLYFTISHLLHFQNIRFSFLLDPFWLSSLFWFVTFVFFFFFFHFPPYLMMIDWEYLCPFLRYFLEAVKIP